MARVRKRLRFDPLEQGLPALQGLLPSSWFLPRSGGADVPTLLLTSRDGAEARAKALRRGTGECLTRPPHPEELIARAVGLLRRPSKWQRVAWVQAGPLTAHTRRMEARLYDKDLEAVFKGNQVGAAGSIEGFPPPIRSHYETRISL